MVATPGSGSIPAPQPPPPIPQDPAISNTLTNYLSQFSLWCRKGFAAKLNSGVALNGVMLRSANAPAGVNPTIWLLQVSQTGVLATIQVPLGGANPSSGVTLEPPP